MNHYDESGCDGAIPPHPIQQTRDDLKPERYTAKHTHLPNGWKLIRREDGEDIIHHPEAGIVGRMSFGDEFAAALTAQPVTGDAALRDALVKVRDFLHDRHVVYVDETDLWDAKETIEQALATVAPQPAQPSTVLTGVDFVALVRDVDWLRQIAIKADRGLMPKNIDARGVKRICDDVMATLTDMYQQPVTGDAGLPLVRVHLEQIESMAKQMIQRPRQHNHTSDILARASMALEALATAPQPAQPAWRDISSAPKDGTRILVWADTHMKTRRGHSVIAYWGNHKDGGETWLWHDGKEWMGPDVATHWMPLPAAPSNGRAE